MQTSSARRATRIRIPRSRRRCATRAGRVGAWRDPLPLERDASGKRFVYAVLLPARGRDGELAQAGGAVCLRFMSAGLGLPAWGASGSLKVSLPAAMREQMLAYARREGVVDVSLDPICAPLLCQPD